MCTRSLEAGLHTETWMGVPEKKNKKLRKGHLEWSWLQTLSHIPLAWYQLALHTEDGFEFGAQSQMDPLMMLTRKVQKILRTKQNHSAWLVFQLRFSE